MIPLDFHPQWSPRSLPTRWETPAPVPEAVQLWVLGQQQVGGRWRVGGVIPCRVPARPAGCQGHLQRGNAPRGEPLRVEGERDTRQGTPGAFRTPFSSFSNIPVPPAPQLRLIHHKLSFKLKRKKSIIQVTIYGLADHSQTPWEVKWHHD